MRNERGKGTSRGKWQRVRGERRTITVRKGQSDGETKREDTGDLHEEESRRGMRTGVTGWARGAPAFASPCLAPALALSPAVRTHFVTITGPSLGRDCFPQIVVL